MPTFCKECGRQIQEGANFCKYCGKALTVKMDNTCKKCGTPYTEGALFCRKCGNSLESAEIEEVAGNQSHITTQSSINKTPKIDEKASPKLLKKQKSFYKSLIASVLVFALLLGTITFGLYKCDDSKVMDKNQTANNPKVVESFKLTDITYSEEELDVEGTIVAVSPDNPLVMVGDTLVDFGAFNLYGDSKLEMKLLAQKTDNRTGVTVNAYNFTLSDDTSGEIVSAFPTLVDITIPCTASEEEHAFVQYYNEDTHEWKIIDSTRDYENKTLTFQTTHFSIYGESNMIISSEYNIGQIMPEQSFAYIGGYDGPLTEVYFVSADLNKLMSNMDFNKLIEILNSCKVNPNDIASALMGLGNDAANVLELDVSHKLINTMLRLEPKVSYWSKNLSIIGSSLIFAKVAYQLYIGGDVETVAYINAFDITESLLTIAGLAVGSEALLMLATIIFLGNASYSLATMEFTSIQEQGYINFNDSLGAVFYAESMSVAPRDMVSLSQAYYQPSGPILLDRGGKGFARALDAIYIHYKDKPGDLQKALENLIEGYVNCFWDSNSLTNSDKVHYSYYKEKYDRENPPKWIQPSDANIQNYKDKFRLKLMSDIKPLMRDFAERVVYDLKQILREKIENEYVPFLNTVITIEADVKSTPANDLSFDKSIYGTDYYMEFIDPNLPNWINYEDYLTDYNPHKNKDSNEIYKSTVYNFLQIGDPTEIKLNNQSGVASEEEELLAEISWEEFPVGKITIIDNKDKIGYLTLYKSEDASDYQVMINKLLRSNEKIKLDTSKKDIFSIQAASSISEKGDPPNDPNDYTIEFLNIQASNLYIEGGLQEADICTINANIVYERGSEKVEKSFGEYPSVETWISNSKTNYNITGTGTVSYQSVYDDKLGNVKIMVLSFDSVVVSGNNNYKLIFEYQGSSSKTSEVRDEKSSPIDIQDFMILKFIVN